MLASTIMAVALATAGQAESKWETVTSQDGTFTVEMPAVEGQTGSVPLIAPGFSGVSGKQRETMRQSGRVTYLILELEGRGPIAKADEEKWTAVARSQAVGRHGPGARLVSEKPVQAGAIAGREFLVSHESMGGPTTIIRGRAFIRGSTLVALVVTGGPGDKELPPEAGRFLGSFASADPAKTAAAREKKDAEPSRFDPSRLVGVWELVKSTEHAQAGSVLELTRDGQFKSTLKGQDITFTGTYKLAGDQLIYDPPGFGATLSELTAARMVLDDKEYRRKGGPVAGGPRGAPRVGGGVAGSRPRAGAGAGPWQVVTSREDGFSVAMPGPPADERQGGGGVGVHILTSQEGGVDLLVMAVQAPVEVPEAQKAKILETLRERAVSTKFGAEFKVVTESPDRLGPLEGRRFDLTIARADIGTVKARGRSFAHGKAAYVLLAVSREADAALPSDAAKFLDSFALAGVASGSGATAKGPRAGARPARIWGTPVDPDGDVRIRPSDRSLTMAIPASPHLLAPERGKMNAPRVVAPTEDDFVVSVRVDGKFNPGDKSTVKGLSSRQAGGLILWKDAENYLVFQRRASVGDEGDESSQAVLEELVGGKKGVTSRQAAAGGPLYLRLERTKGRVEAGFSLDGKQWREIKPVATTWAEGELQVGVVAVSTSTGPHEVTFDSYTLKAK